MLRTFLESICDWCGPVPLLHYLLNHAYDCCPCLLYLHWVSCCNHGKLWFWNLKMHMHSKLLLYILPSCWSYWCGYHENTGSVTSWWHYMLTSHIAPSHTLLIMYFLLYMADVFICLHTSIWSVQYFTYYNILQYPDKTCKTHMIYPIYTQQLSCAIWYNL